MMENNRADWAAGGNNPLTELIRGFFSVPFRTFSRNTARSPSGFNPSGFEELKKVSVSSSRKRT
jgi:hypothetical protein